MEEHLCDIHSALRYIRGVLIADRQGQPHRLWEKAVAGPEVFAPLQAARPGTAAVGKTIRDTLQYAGDVAHAQRGDRLWFTFQLWLTTCVKYLTLHPKWCKIDETKRTRGVTACSPSQID